MGGHEKLYSFPQQGSVPCWVRARDAHCQDPMAWLLHFLHLGFGTEPFLSLVNLVPTYSRVWWNTLSHLTEDCNSYLISWPHLTKYISRPVSSNIVVHDPTSDVAMLKHVAQCSAGYGRATRSESRVVQLHPDSVAAFLSPGPEYITVLPNVLGTRTAPILLELSRRVQHNFPEAGLLLCPLPKALRAYSTFTAESLH